MRGIFHAVCLIRIPCNTFFDKAVPAFLVLGSKESFNSKISADSKNSCVLKSVFSNNLDLRATISEPKKDCAIRQNVKFNTTLGAFNDSDSSQSSDTSSNLTNWSLKIKGVDVDKIYPVDLNMFSRASELFAVGGSAKIEDALVPPVIPESDGEIQIYSSSANFRTLGLVSDTVKQLKLRVQAVSGIDRLRQRLSPHPPSSQDRSEPARELQEDWKRLSDYGVKSGDCLSLELKAPWIQFDWEAKTIHLSLPDPCVGHVLEACLAYLHDGAQTRALSPDTSPSDAVAMLWLAKVLRARPLEDALRRHLAREMHATSAPAFLLPALRLGLDDVARAARSLAAQCLDLVIPDTLCRLPIEELEALLLDACAHSDVNVPAWAPAWAAATYLVWREEAEQGLDSLAFRRLANLLVHCAVTTRAAAAGAATATTATPGI